MSPHRLPVVSVTLSLLGCVSALGTTNRLYTGTVPPSQIARVQVFTTSELRIGTHYVPRQGRGGGRFVEVTSGTYPVKVGSYPEFQWQAMGGEAYSLGVTQRNLATDSTIVLFFPVPYITRTSTGEVSGPPLMGSAFTRTDSSAMYPPGMVQADARIELAKPLILTGFSGRTADGRRLSCAEGLTYLTQLTPQRAVPTAACGQYVRAKSLRVLPGTYTVEVVYAGGPFGSGGPTSETVQVELGDVVTLAPDVRVKLAGSDVLRLRVTKAKQQ